MSAEKCSNKSLQAPIGPFKKLVEQAWLGLLNQEPNLKLEARFEYLEGVYDLDDQMQKKTLTSYNNGSETYVKKQWKPEMIKSMFEAIFLKRLDIFDSLPPDARILFSGVGGKSEAVVTSLLYPTKKIYATDISESLLRDGGKKVTKEIITKVAQMLMGIVPDRKDPISGKSRYFVHFLNQKTIEMNSHLGIQNDEQFGMLAMDKITEVMVRNHFVSSGDIREPQFQKGSLDFSLNVGVFPHLKKSEIPLTVQRHLALLKPGRSMQFNIKADAGLWESGEQGRVFFDTDLGPGKKRYFNTYTLAEIQKLIANLKAENPEIEKIEIEERSPHLISKKPDFVNLFVKKKGAA